MGGIKSSGVVGCCGLLVALSGCVGQGEKSIDGAENVTYSSGGYSVLALGKLGNDAEQVAARFSGPAAELGFVAKETDELGYVHSKYEQRIQGVRVLGGNIRISADASGKVRSAYGTSLDYDVDMDPAIEVTDASDRAFAATNGATELLDAELVVVVPSSGAVPTLAWRVEVSGEDAGMPLHDDVFVDAVNGDIVDRHPMIHSAKNRQTYDAAGRNNAQLVRSEGDEPVGNSDIDQAHDAAGLTYDCLLDLFGRDSYDNQGETLRSIARINDQNAYWDGRSMYYGNGFAVADVGTHEFGHAVTSSTANLVYQNEPGALNEAASDILASICDAYKNGGIVESTFLMGENIGGGNGRYIRNLRDPEASGSDSRDHYDSRYLGNQDNGGVHINSGIANLAFVLLTEGGTHPRNKTDVEVVGVGIENSAQIFYRALTNYMGRNTNFAQGRAAFEQAAADLHGEESSEVYSVREAFAAVGVGTAPVGERPSPTPPVDETPVDDVDDGEDRSGQDIATPNVVTGGCSTGNNGGAPLWFLWMVALAVLRLRSVSGGTSFRVTTDEVKD